MNQDSVVFDIGGYEGQWTSDIFSMYNCRIYLFEPIKIFADKIKIRFTKNNKIRVYDFGLAGSTREAKISLAAESSSIFKSGEKNETIKLFDICEFLDSNKIEQIDLMKINIEGGEYELLEKLIETNLVKKIKNLQIQFHDFVPEAENRMKKIQENLKTTHHLTYQYEFVWENWEIN